MPLTVKFGSTYREIWSIGRETLRRMLKPGDSRETRQSWQACIKQIAIYTCRQLCDSLQPTSEHSWVGKPPLFSPPASPTVMNACFLFGTLLTLCCLNAQHSEILHGFYWPNVRFGKLKEGGWFSHLPRTRTLAIINNCHYYNTCLSNHTLEYWF